MVKTLSDPVPTAAKERPRAATWRLRAAGLALWPDTCPTAPPFEHGWVHRGNERMLRRLLAKRRPKVVVELGSWLGLCTTLLLEETEESGAAVFAVDPWDAAFLRSDETLHRQYARDPTAVRILDTVPLYDTFLVNVWPYRQRCFPMRMTSGEGLAAIARLGAPVGMVYVDADHSYDAVRADLRACAAHFPDALLCGDDWQWPAVQRAVTDHAASHAGLAVHADPTENWWWLEGPAEGAPPAAGCTRKRRRVEFVAAEESSES